ncbi:hypothetical protein NP493_96g05033 [Ridgeia piscesae]|uniref:Uncharacterized protein n=1 Tax=Ridgeia piscesae TaxID=27915 RepID=A0AAD9UHK0_RIDPI|nr:hypothetical protein NP493_96g05033 [Ridgeia piscesae]
MRDLRTAGWGLHGRRSSLFVFPCINIDGFLRFLGRFVWDCWSGAGARMSTEREDIGWSAGDNTTLCVGPSSRERNAARQGSINTPAGDRRVIGTRGSLLGTVECPIWTMS